MYPSRSSAVSSQGGALWWIEGPAGARVVRSTQFASLVWLFQMSAIGVLGSDWWIQYPQDGNCDAATWGILSGNRIANTPSNTYFITPDSLKVTGVFDLATAVALGAMMCSGSMASGNRSFRFAVDIHNNHVSRETIQSLILFAMHAQNLSHGALLEAWQFDLSLDDIAVPADVVLPDMGAPNEVAVADLPWIGSSPVGAPPPVPPSVQILQATGQPAETVPQAEQKKAAENLVGKSILVAGLGGLAAVLWTERSAIARALGL